MKTKQVKLGDLFQVMLGKFNLAIKDELLLKSLNSIELQATDGLELIYPIDKPLELPKIPKVSAHDILKEVDEKEHLFNKFWFIYNKSVGKGKCKIKFMKLSYNVIQKILETLPYYIKHTPDVKFRKDPYTYLNQEVWEDDFYMPRKIAKSEVPSAFKF